MVDRAAVEESSASLDRAATDLTRTLEPVTSRKADAAVVLCMIIMEPSGK